MRATLRSLLSGVLDYAGLFPPAKLSLADALRNYASYLKGEAAWLLGRFVCPCVRLGEVDAQRAALTRAGHDPWRFSGLGRGGEDEPSLLAGLRADLTEVSGIHHRLEGHVRVEAMETRLPPSVVAQSAAEVRRMALIAAEMWSDATAAIDPSTPSFFLEITPGENGAQALAHAVEGVRATQDRTRILGLKLRTGGVEAHQIPPVRQVACFLAECAAAGVPFKATAGLHHPLRHDSHEVGTKMHGFLNVFIAAAMAHARRLPAEVLEEVLAEEDARAFTITDEGMAWRGHMLTPEQIRASRAALATSFGSCSLMEPVEDLRKLGWW